MVVSAEDFLSVSVASLEVSVAIFVCSWVCGPVSEEISTLSPLHCVDCARISSIGATEQYSSSSTVASLGIEVYASGRY